MHQKNDRGARIRLGQHMLKSPEIAERIIQSSEIGPSDRVLEIGTGLGFLTRGLAERAGSVQSYEIDNRLYDEAAITLIGYKNLQLVKEDAFQSKTSMDFDVCVTSLPYSQSLRFMKWLAVQSGKFLRALAVVQREFATKLCANPGEPEYRAVSVLAQLSFRIERLFLIDKDKFDPPPRVLSECLRFTPRQDISEPFFDASKIRLLDYLFSFRGRRLSAAAAKVLGKGSIPPGIEDLVDRRVEKLSPDEFNRILKLLPVRATH
jgi:16S rRNA (adenine1518-N6/adenine1519-N6)-dimethyltransferase